MSQLDNTYLSTFLTILTFTSHGCSRSGGGWGQSAFYINLAKKVWGPGAYIPAICWRAESWYIGKYFFGQVHYIKLEEQIDKHNDIE